MFRGLYYLTCHIKMMWYPCIFRSKANNEPIVKLRPYLELTDIYNTKTPQLVTDFKRCYTFYTSTGLYFNCNIIRTNEYVCFGLIWYWHDITSIKHTNSSFLCSLLNPSFHTNINRLESFVVVVCSSMAVDMCSWNRSFLPHRPHLNF